MNTMPKKNPQVGLRPAQDDVPIESGSTYLKKDGHGPHALGMGQARQSGVACSNSANDMLCQEMVDSFVFLC